MNLDITIEHPDAERELRSLQSWLTADDLLVGTAPGLVSSRTARDGEMGPILDVLQLVIGGAIGAADLALAIAAWRRGRGEPPTLELNQGGATITLRGASDDDVRRLAAFLQIAADPVSRPDTADADSAPEAEVADPDASADTGSGAQGGSVPEGDEALGHDLQGSDSGSRDARRDAHRDGPDGPDGEDR
ncbi:effector-associated constant component EACC1 [Yinghuangia sp. YIM S09857]|uniref:effector-associated constant component EACC1 n=1 Tax=Yinghuangia sp. YIM S09857 TaxID=3436929 RepID=UPI003F52C483